MVNENEVKSVTVRDLIKSHSQLPILHRNKGPGDRVVAGAIIRDPSLIAKIKSGKSTTLSMASSKALVEIHKIKKKTRKVTVKYITVPGSPVYTIPLIDLFPINDLLVPIRVPSKKYGDHIAYLRVMDSIKDGAGNVKVEIVACEVSEGAAKKIKDETGYKEETIKDIQEAANKMKNTAKGVGHEDISKRLSKIISNLKKSSSNGDNLSEPLIEVAREIKNGNVSPKEISGVLKELADEVRKDMEDNWYYDAEDLMTQLSAHGGRVEVSDKNDSIFKLPVNLIESSVLSKIGELNGRMCNDSGMKGREVTYKPNKKKCKIVEVLENGEIIVQFKEQIKDGHSLDGMKPQGTCLNTDESMLTVKREVRALSVKLNKYKQ